MHRKKCWGMVLALVVLGATAAALYPREPLLLEHATRILDMRPADPNYAWLSDHEVIYFRSDDNLWRRDTRTGTETVLPTLTRQMKESISFQMAHLLVPSPDGKWVLWGQSVNTPLFVASIDGTRRLSWPIHGGVTVSVPHWLSDSRRWMEWVFGNGNAWIEVNTHTLATPNQSRTASSLPPGLKGLDILAVQSEDFVIARTRDVEILGKPTPSGAGYIAISSVITYRDTQELSVWSLDSPKPLHQFTIHLPGLVKNVRVSPQGDRVAWIVERQYVSPVFKLLQRLFPALKKDEHESLAIYVSHLDGSHLHEIGRVDRKSSSVWRLIEEMHWLPTGKSLSFIANDTLWTVPVE